MTETQFWLIWIGLNVVVVAASLVLPVLLDKIIDWSSVVVDDGWEGY